MFKLLGKAHRVKPGPRAALTILLSAIPLTAAVPAHAAGDLLIAPTRVILDSPRGTEVILNNIGDEEATYRVTLELRRMNDQGKLEDVNPESITEKEKAALTAVRYAPRRVTLPPNQPQSIRIGIQPDAALPDGEYRAHMLFRAIPKTPPADVSGNTTEGFRIQITPIYGISIPVIVRKGNLEATATLSNVRFGMDEEGPTLELDLNRSGDRSLFGEIHVSKPGIPAPVSVTKGIAAYPEIARRTVSIPITPQLAVQLRGEVIISYYEAPEAGGGLISQVRSILP
ncbi:molecular chaperone [Sphingorhabdus sp.]|uniref:fimbrial biogenesis chaperone n=1 Tax=Sphingorhabdus sp. TaxID=1902408 RepID=UPI0039192D93